jgi:hypothetical protein
MASPQDRTSKVAERLIRGLERSAKQQEDRRHSKERLASHDRRETVVVVVPKLDLLEGGHA